MIEGISNRNIILCLISGILVLILYFVYSKYLQSDKQSVIIPKVIYQTYKDKNVPPIVKERWMKLNPEYQYHLYDDNDCYNFLMKYYGKKHADFFKYQIKDGPIKSDFWRVCVLYQFGGVYADVDILPYVPIREFLNKDTTLYTCTESPILSGNLNPHFIAVTPKNILMKRCIDKYMKEIINEPYDYWVYSITRVLFGVADDFFKRKKKEMGGRFYEGVYKTKDQVLQISQEINKNDGDVSSDDPHGMNDYKIIQNGRIIMKNRDNTYNWENHSFN